MLTLFTKPLDPNRRIVGFFTQDRVIDPVTGRTEGYEVFCRRRSGSIVPQYEDIWLADADISSDAEDLHILFANLYFNAAELDFWESEDLQEAIKIIARNWVGDEINFGYIPLEDGLEIVGIKCPSGEPILVDEEEDEEAEGILSCYKNDILIQILESCLVERYGNE